MSASQTQERLWPALLSKPFLASRRGILHFRSPGFPIRGKEAQDLCKRCNLFFGNMAEQRLYAVSLYPERSVILPGRTVPEDLLRRFIPDNQDLLADPRNSIGIWYSNALHAIYLDVSATLPDRVEAVSLGEWYNQEAIYDLGHDKVLGTGGTGEWHEGWASELRRLPPLQRQQKAG